jgi:carboxyl-terminal processing protease
VNGESIEGLRLPDVIKKIAGPLGSDVTLTCKHATGETVDITMTREEIVVPTVKGYQRKPDNTWDYFVSDDPKIAYLRITQFTSETYDRMKEVMSDLMKQGMDGLILDLRFNPGGRLDQAVQIVDMFVDHGVIVSTKGRNRPEQKIEATSEGTLPKFPMIVLVNEHSASASEIVSGSLKDNNRALVIGTRTYGKGSVQEVIPLDSKGGELKLTVAYYYLPSGRLVHKKKDATDWGVEPNITVPMDLAAEGKVLRDRLEQELMKRPVPKAATNPKTAAATTQVIDTQLQRAVDTMVAVLVLDQNKSDGKAKVVPPIATKVSPLPTTSTATPASQSAPAMPVVSPAPTTKSSPATKKAAPATSGASK